MQRTVGMAANSSHATTARHAIVHFTWKHPHDSSALAPLLLVTLLPDYDTPETHNLQNSFSSLRSGTISSLYILQSLVSNLCGTIAYHWSPFTTIYSQQLRIYTYRIYNRSTISISAMNQLQRRQRRKHWLVLLKSIKNLSKCTIFFNATIRIFHITRHHWIYVSSFNVSLMISSWKRRSQSRKHWFVLLNYIKQYRQSFYSRFL